MTLHDSGTARYLNLIDGQLVPARSGKTFDSVNPASGVVWATAADGGPEDVDDAVTAAQAALDGQWGRSTGFERAALMRRLADLIDANADRIAEIESRDNGKLLREMSGQVKSLSSWYHYFAGLADKVRGASIPTEKPNYFVYTTHEPVGVVAAIIPWNSPLLLLAWKLAPALAAGCTVVVKPSDYTPASVIEFGKLFAEAGFPPGVFNVVTGFGPEVGKALTAHPGIGKIAFTGSTETGRLVARAAAENLNPTLLELGGKSAQLIFADADLEAAANGVVAGVFAAAGQTCIAGSRVYVHESVHAELVRRVTERARTIVIGDPLETATEMGPLATEDQFQKVLGHFDTAREQGAEIVYGGSAVEGADGYFVHPTIIDNAAPHLRAVQEEIFGPVVTIAAFTDESEAVDLANGTRFGLAASVWTKDVHRAHRVAARLEAGSVWVNAYRVVSPAVPFGGYKLSGIGRENGAEAVLAFTETKSVWIELSGETRDPFVMG